MALRRIEGQIRGIARMIEDGKYCVDIVSQIRAARAALGTVETKVLSKHIENCVAEALRSGSDQVVQEKLDEIVDYVGRTVK